MKKPARRDGTPDRNNKKQRPTRSEAGGRSDRSEAGGRPSRSETDRRPSRSDAVKGKPGRPDAAAAKNKRGKPKSAKPQRAQAQAPKISNAKPARHQYADAADRPAGPPQGDGMRLQKVLAQAGVASRRAAEELISQGRVEVDGRIVIEQGLRIDPENAVVRVDGVRVVVQKDLVHLALNKPRGWQSTMSDDLGRPCVGDIVCRAGRRRSAVVPRRSPGRRHRGAAAAHQRRRSGAPADAPVLRGVEDLPGDRVGCPSNAPSESSSRRASNSTTDRRRSTRSRSSRSARASRWCGSCCTRAASTSCGACSSRRAPGDPARAHGYRRRSLSATSVRAHSGTRSTRGRRSLRGGGAVSTSNR